MSVLSNLPKSRASRLLLCALLALPMSAACAGSLDGEPTEGDLAAQELAAPSTNESGFADTLLGLSPVGYWRLGDALGFTVTDSSGHGHDGVYVNAPPGTDGAIVGDPNGAVELTASTKTYVEIPDHDDFSLVKAQDTFGRVVHSGSSFGTSDHGGPWQSEFSHGSCYSSDGARAQIDETTAAATWGQSLGLQRSDVDLQVKVSWDQPAEGGPIRPMILLARMQGNTTFYMVELRENVGGQLDLLLRRNLNGVSADLSVVANVGQYTPGDAWYVRFQVEGSALRAKAWAATQAQPAAWLASARDSNVSGPGRVGIRSTNSGSATRLTVSIDDFRAQSVGMTVHAFVRPDALDFDTPKNGYVHFLGKGEDNAHEWGFRFYPQRDRERPNRISAYAWNPTGLVGAGGYFQDALVAGRYLEIVAVYDAGDALDPTAGVRLYRDGGLRKAPPSPGTLYSNPEYLVMPENGSAPLRIGTRDKKSFLTGAIDEVAIFDRKLSPAEIDELFQASK